MISIRVRHINKTYISQSAQHKRVQALNDISFDVEEGEILGLLGPNGAGKTTLLNILSTLVTPDSGDITILGIPSIPKRFTELKSLLNMSSGYPNFPWSLTVEENLQFYGRLYGLNKQALKNKIEELVDLFSLKEFIHRRFDELSSGTKQRLSLSKALLNDPKIIFLDEPTIGLDPDVAQQTRRVILDILKRKKITVLFTTHNMPEVEMMCNRIAFINGGRLLRLATPQELKDARGKKELEDVFIDLAKEKGEALLLPLNNDPKQLARISLPRESFFTSIAKWFNRMLAFFIRNAIFAWRNVFALAELIFWPAVSLISIGLLGDFLELREQAVAFILTGAMTGGILQVAQLDVAYSLLYDVWSKSVKHTFLTPTGVAESLFGSWLTGIIRGGLIFILLGLSAMLMFGFKFPPLLVTLIFLFGIMLSAILLGMIVTILMLLFGQKADITAWMFAYLFMMLCGIYYPIQTLPPFFYQLAQWFPLTYFLEYFRQSFGFAPQFPHLLIKGFVLTILYLALGLCIIHLAVKRARRNGIIVRLSE
jgi:ABC-type multidrug transport system ATPase subunit/ABC-type multidrug transport system permease subunit